MSTPISAAAVNELRKLTGVGMMECKKALERSNGNLEGAIEELRKSGIAKAGKIAGRVAAEGVIVIADGAMVEVNCQTDFVARDSSFIEFAKTITEAVSQTKTTDIAALSALPCSGYAPKTIEERRQELIAKLGENIQIRRIALAESSAETIGTYIHGNRIGVMVALDTNNNELARDIAMHIAASKPLVIAPENVSKDLVEKENEIYLAQAANSGKPQDIIEKMVAGRLKKYLDEVSLMGQPFVRDPDVTVGNLLNKHRAKVLAFYRFEVGEGIEKTTEDFKEAVMSQIQGS